MKLPSYLKLDREDQKAINMVDLMMWLVIAALLLAAAIQAIGYYQKATYIYLLKSDLTGVASRVMGEASLARGVIDTETVGAAASNSNWSAEVSYAVEESNKSPYLRATHPGVTDLDALYLFEACPPYGVGVHIVPKGGNVFLEGCGISSSGNGSGSGGSNPQQPMNPDIDGDGIPNEIDWDANGDGVDDDEIIPAGYTPGGKTTGADGTPYTVLGNYESSRLTNGGTSVYVTFYMNYGNLGKGVSLDVTGTCIRADKTTYEDRRIAVYTVASDSPGAVGTTVERCGTDRMTGYTIKPLTKEAVQAGVFTNSSDATQYTIIDGVRWSEPDGYPKSGNFESSYVSSGGTKVTAVFYVGQSPQGQRLVSEFKAICERTNQPGYKVSRLVYAQRDAYETQDVVDIPVCADGRVDSYTIKPLVSLSGVENRMDFTSGYTMDRSYSWEESANGYRVSGNLEAANVNYGGKNIEARAYIPYGTVGTTFNTQAELTCEAADKTTRKVNRLASYTATTAYFAQLFNITGCGNDRIVAFSLKPVYSLGIVENKDEFTTGYTFAGTVNWSESVNGYPVLGNLESVSLVDNDTNIVVRAYVPYGNLNRLINTQYELTCKAADGTTRKVNRIASYTSTTNNGGAIAFTVPACGADQLMAYTFTKVYSLGIVENPDDFKTVTFDRTYSWTR